MRTYYLLCGLLAALVLPSVHALVKNRTFDPETADWSVFGALIVYTAVAMLLALVYARGLRRGGAIVLSSRGQTAAGLLLLAIFVASASVITVLVPFEDALWFGYGHKIALIAVLALPIVIALLRTNHRLLHVAGAIVTFALVLVFYLPSIVQPPWGLIDGDHSGYVLNEVLGPQAYGYPLVNFTAQYTSLLGYIFNVALNSSGTLDQAVWFLTVLAVAVVVVALVPLARAYPAGKRYLALLYTVPAIFIVKPKEDRYSGSISVLLSALPVRLLFAALIASLLVTRGIREARWRSTAFLAFTAALAIVNNVESGVVGTIASAMVLTLAGKTALRLYQPSLFIVLVVAFFTLDMLVLAAFFGKPDLTRLTAFVGGFGGGFGAIEMPSFGLWVFVFVLLSVGATAATLHFRLLARTNDATDQDETWRLGVLVLFWSAFGLGMSPYYINRSTVSGQLQFLLLPVFIASAALFPVMSRYARKTWNLALVVAAFPCALSVAAIVQHPSIRVERARLDPGTPTLSQSWAPAVASVREKVAHIKAAGSDSPIALYMDSGFVFGSALHLRSYMPVNSGEDVIVSPAAFSGLCASLRESGTRILISMPSLNDSAKSMVTQCGYAVTDRFGTKPEGIMVLERQ